MLGLHIKLAKFIEDNSIIFYLEHNDFESGNLSINEELSDLRDELELTVLESIECYRIQSIWSARFYYEGNLHKIAYAAKCSDVLNKIIKIMEEHYEITL